MDPTFSPEELLYYRVTDLDVTGKVNVDEIRAPDTSVNRGRFSLSHQVLYSVIPAVPLQKVVQLQVQEIPDQLLTGDGRPINFKVEHDPLVESASSCENYSHSEIRAFENNARVKRPSEFVLKKYRMKLRDVMVLAPAAAPPPPGI